MPIEIRELVLRAVIDPPEDRQGTGAGTVAPEERQEIIEAAVAATLEVLRRQRER
jgi:hypothetical protein